MKKSKSLVLVLTGAILLFGSIQGHSAYKFLSMKRYYQHKSNWCWAAISQIIREYNKDFFRWQCKMAAALVANSTNEYCCGTDGYYESSIPYPPGSEQDARCNQPLNLETAMLWNGIFGNVYPGLIATSLIVAEINALRPIGLRIGWYSGGEHFILLYGYNTTVSPDRFYLWDPFYGASYLTRDGINDYRGAGTCTHTYTSTR